MRYVHVIDKYSCFKNYNLLPVVESSKILDNQI